MQNVHVNCSSDERVMLFTRGVLGEARFCINDPRKTLLSWLCGIIDIKVIATALNKIQITYLPCYEINFLLHSFR